MACILQLSIAREAKGKSENCFSAFSYSVQKVFEWRQTKNSGGDNETSRNQ